MRSVRALFVLVHASTGPSKSGFSEVASELSSDRIGQNSVEIAMAGHCIHNSRKKKQCPYNTFEIPMTKKFPRDGDGRGHTSDAKIENGPAVT